MRDLTLRGTYSTAFRAPKSSELFLGQTGGFFESSQDPCANTHGTRRSPTDARPRPGPPVDRTWLTTESPWRMINCVVGGNPALQPEKAKIATVGVVFEPRCAGL